MDRDDRRLNSQSSDDAVYGAREKEDAHGTKPEQERVLGAEESECVEGWKLWIILASMALVMFIMMLDMAIITTVSSAIF